VYPGINWTEHFGTIDKTLTVVDLLNRCVIDTKSCSPVVSSEVTNSAAGNSAVSTVKDRGEDWISNKESGKMTDFTSISSVYINV